MANFISSLTSKSISKTTTSRQSKTMKRSPQSITDGSKKSNKTHETNSPAASPSSKQKPSSPNTISTPTSAGTDNDSINLNVLDLNLISDMQTPKLDHSSDTNNNLSDSMQPLPVNFHAQRNYHVPMPPPYYMAAYNNNPYNHPHYPMTPPQHGNAAFHPYNNHTHNVYPHHYPNALDHQFMMYSSSQDQRKGRKRQTAGQLLVNGLFQRASGPGGTTPVAAPSGGHPPATKGTKKKQSTAQPRPRILIQPRGIGPVHVPNQNDVLAGRGGRINAHPGNVQFREIVAQRKKDYLDKNTKKLDKAHIAADIVYYIRSMNPSGRFLKEEQNGTWFDIGDAKAIKKVGQALREDAPDIRGDEDEHTKDGKKPETTRSKSPKSRARSEKDGSNSDGNEASPEQAKKPEHSKKSEQATQRSPEQASPVPSSHPTPATAVSGRGGKMNMSPPQPQPMAEVQIAPPLNYQKIMPPPARHMPNNHISSNMGPHAPHPGSPHHAPFYQTIGMRGMMPRTSPAVSGAAQAMMEPPNNVEVPEELFGRNFHPPAEKESSMVSGMSGISALTDPISAISASETSGYQGGGSIMNREERLDCLRQQWNQSNFQSSNVTASANANMLSASGAGIGNSLTSSAIRDAERMDDNMSWACMNSLRGGGSVRDDSFLYSSTHSGSRFEGYEPHPYYQPPIQEGATLEDATLDSFSLRDDITFMSTGSRPNAMHPPSRSGASVSSIGNSLFRSTTPRMSNSNGPQQQYFSGTASITSMSINSGDMQSLASVQNSIMSDLSGTLHALDLADGTSSYSKPSYRNYHHQTGYQQQHAPTQNFRSDDNSCISGVVYEGREMLEI